MLLRKFQPFGSITIELDRPALITILVIGWIIWFIYLLVWLRAKRGLR